MKRSRGEPIIDRSEQEVSDTIDANYRKAVLMLRDRVEENGERWQDAMLEVQMRVPLGMHQVHEIEDKAREMYGQKDAAG